MAIIVLMSGSKSFQVGQIRSGGNSPFFIIGPCVIESEDFVRTIAQDLKKICQTINVPWIFKASYDKANRTSAKSYRGIGLKSGCRILSAIGEEFNVPVTTDVHSVEEAQIASDFVDVLQIPAFLCRQTDLIQAAAATGRAINVKKGQFLAPWDVANIAEKLESAGCGNYVFTERGVTFGYNNLVADMRSLYWIRKQGYPVVFDATHSVQRPGSTGTSTGGDGELAPVLARSAMAAGCDGIFIETHPNPAEALSDGPNQIPLSDLPQLLSQLKKIHEVVR
ncbi:MAG TPA: 3-deoxy-8-phosphooctulonate synthase [Chthoniobacterales bacterium]|nr:3-deoxy-8-phosphooctulonate synthase [Chthoniobacterales bacterium]